VIRFAKSILAGERGRSCRRAQATSAITRSDVVCHFWRSNAPKSSVRRPSRTFSIRHSTRSRVYGVTLAQRCTACGMPFAHNDIQLFVPVRRRHGLRICRFAVHKPGSASQIQPASLASCGCSRAASDHQRHSHLCATNAASFSQIVPRFAGQRTRHLPSLAQHSDPTVP